MREVPPEISPLILTLKFDSNLFNLANSLRQKYFPPERNFLHAHVTLFHALPGVHEKSIAHHLKSQCNQTSRIPLELPTLRFLGKGVAIEIHAPTLVQLRETLANHWHDWLTPQDRQRYKPHITVQNKVEAAAARLVYDELTTSWKPLEGYGEGLQLWYYRNGPWELAEEFAFN